ncbi:MAG: hypothetical protein K8R54_15955 [Bacteroidales bacterium]|nr:hypothetical protein [Bacteroidales bacterium]
MEIFEKHLNSELNIFRTIIFKLNLKSNKALTTKFEQYKEMSNNLKYMFLINEAEKEIRENENLRNINVLIYNKKDNDILKYLDRAFSV